MRERPESNDVSDRVIPAPIYLPIVESEARKLFRRGDVRGSFYGFLDRASQGSSEAQAVTAYMYLLGYVHCENRKEVARYWAEKSASANCPYGLWVYGWLHLEDRNFVSGLRLLVAAADKGFLPALYRLGSFSVSGILVPKNPERGRALLAIAATRGHTSARRALHELYRTRGFGPAKALIASISSPLEIFRRAIARLSSDPFSEMDLTYFRAVPFELEYKEDVLGKKIDPDLQVESDKIMQELRLSI